MSLELSITLIAAVVAIILTVWMMSKRTGGLKHRIIGDDIFVDLWVSKEQVAAEAQVEFPDPITKGKTITITLPSDMGTRFALRMQGKGPQKAEGGRGDLYINLKVKSPYVRV